MGMVSVISGGSFSTPSTSATNFYVFGAGVGAWNATESRIQFVIPVAGTLDYFRAKLGTAPGAAASGKQWDFTIRQQTPPGASADSALTLNIFETATSNADTTHSVTVAAGDLITIKSVPTGTPNTSSLNTFCVRFTHASTNNGLIMGGSQTALTGSGTTQYQPVQGDMTAAASETNIQSLMPTGGTFDQLYVDTDAVQGAGKTLDVTLVVNGTPSALTCQLANSKTGNDTTHSVTVNAGDTVSYKLVPSATATGGRTRVGMRWQPTIDGESLGLTNSNPPILQGNTSYNTSAGGSTSWGTEGAHQHLVFANTLKKLYINMVGSVPIGQTVTFTARKNSGNAGSLAVTLNGDGGTNSTITGNDPSNTVLLSDDDLLSLRGVASATSGSVNVRTGWVYYIAPASTALITNWFRGLDQPVVDYLSVNGY